MEDKKNYIKKMASMLDMSLKEYCKYQIICIFLMLFYSIMSVIYPYLVSVGVDTDYSVNFTEKLVKFLSLLLGAGLLMIISEYLEKVFVARFANEMLMRIKNKIYGKLTYMNGEFWDCNKVGDVFAVLQRDVSTMEPLLTSLVGNILSNVFIYLGVSIYILHIDFVLAIILMFSSLFFVWIQRKVGHKVEKNMYKVRKKIGEQSSFLNETLNNMNSIHIAGKVKTIEKTYCLQNKNIVSLIMKQVKLITCGEIMGSGYNVIGILLVMVFGSMRVQTGEMTIGTLFSLVIYVQRLYSPVVSLANQYISIKKCIPIIDKIYAVLSDERVITSGEFSSKENLKGKIVFRNVSFQYPKSNSEILHDFNLSVNQGDIVGIIGENGAGKSTISKLLTRIYKQKTGCIEIDDKAIQDYDLEYWRSQIGYLEQKSPILSGTIREICRTDWNKPDDEQIEQYIKKFAIHINDLRDGINTTINENKSNLSGGEGQRLSLIRVLLQDYSIIILDEPTASVDIEAENIICNELKEQLKGKTAIIITHRKKLLEICSKIVRVGNGTAEIICEKASSNV